VRLLVVIALAVLGVVGATAWIVEDEPDWYLRTRYPLAYEHILRAHAKNHDLDPALVAAVVYVESRFDPNARSQAGALGLMQLLPKTAKGIALRTGGARFVVADLRDPEINVRYGTWYLRHLVDRYESTDLALAAYHAGQGNVDKWRRSGSGIAFSETRSYVSRVIELEQIYRRVYADELGSSQPALR
jgi:soluble lytic murein transglycosylase